MSLSVINRGRLTLALAVVILTLAATATGQVDDYDRFQLFNDCQPMDLIVEDLSSDERALGLTKVGIESRVVSHLRSARLYDPSSDAFVYILISALNQAYVVIVELNKVVDDVATTLRYFAATWDRKTIGTGARADTILGVVDEHLNDFIGQYLRVNREVC